MRVSLFCLVFILSGPGCSLTTRNPLACLFDGPSVCGAGTICDAQLNQCVPIGDLAGTADGGMTLPDLGCSSAFCTKEPATTFANDNLRAIWGSSASDIFVAREPTLIHHWNGTAWEYSNGANAIYAISGTSAANVLAVGVTGSIFKWNGRSFTQQPFTGTKNLHALWIESPTSVWVAGDAGFIAHGVGGTYVTSLDQPALGNILGIWGADAQHIWAVTNLGKIVFYDGVTWSPTDLTNGTLYSISGTSAMNVWAVGVSGLAFHFDGSSWTKQQTGLIGSPSLESVWTVDSRTAWAVGDSGIYKWQDSSWSVQPNPTTSVKLHGVWSLKGRETWVVGNSGTFLYLSTP